MPIDNTDQVFVHIQVIDDTHFNYIVFERSEVAPFQFQIRIINYCSKVNGEWQVDSTETF